MAGLDGERLRQQRAIVDLVRYQNQPRTGLVVVELGEKGRQNFAGRDGPISLNTVPGGCAHRGA
jgi:hypothetical protein